MSGNNDNDLTDLPGLSDAQMVIFANGSTVEVDAPDASDVPQYLPAPQYNPATFHETPYDDHKAASGSLIERTAGWGRTIRWRLRPIAGGGVVREVQGINIALPNNYLSPTTIGVRCDVVEPAYVGNIVFGLRFGSGGTNHEEWKPQGTYYVGCSKLTVVVRGANVDLPPFDVTVKISAWVPTVPNNV